MLSLMMRIYENLSEQYVIMALTKFLCMSQNKNKNMHGNLKHLTLKVLLHLSAQLGSS